MTGSPNDGDRLVDLASADPAAALSEASTKAADTEGAGRAKALLAVGIAQRNLGQPQESVSALREALSLATTDEDLSEEIELRLAASLGVVGDFGQAEALLDQLLERVTGARSGIAEHQRATLHQRAGETALAIAGYRRALPLLEQHGERTVAGHIHTNLSILFTYEGRIGEALDELDLAMADYQVADERRWMAMTVHNRGWTVSCTGDLPQGLMLLDEAEELFAALDIPEGPRLATRAEALFRAGLFERAYVELTKAAEEQGRRGLTTDRAETLVMTSRAATNSDREEQALALAEEASSLLADQHRLGWRALAEAARFETRLVSQPSSAVLELAGDLIDAGHTTSGFRVLTSAAIQATQRGDIDEARSLLVAVPPIELTPDEQVQLALATAPLQVADGHPEAGLTTCEEAFRRLDDIMSSFGSLDLIGGAAKPLDELVQLAKTLVPPELADPYLMWADRRRAVGAWRFPRVANPDIVTTVNRYRAMAGQLQETPDDPDVRADLSALAAELQERDWTGGSSRRADDARPTQRATDLLDLSVETVAGPASGYQTVRRTSITGGNPTQTPCTVDLSTLAALDRIHQLWMGAGPAQEPVLADRCRTVAAEVEAQLLDPESMTDGPLSIVVDPELRRLPFPALPSMVTRPFAVSPWAMAATNPRVDPVDGPALFVADPTMVEAERERAAITEVGPWKIADTQSAGTDQLLRDIEGAGTVHLSAHGGVELDNPLFNWLAFPAGRLFLYDLTRLAEAPHVVVVAACLGARDLNRGAAGALSFAEAFLGAGTEWVVAGTSVIPDDPDMVAVLADLHRAMQAGLDPAHALAEARRLASIDGRQRAASAFTCYRA